MSNFVIPRVNARDVAQAVELVRALHDQLHEMTCRLAWLECEGVTRTNGGPSAIRHEAAALRLDIREAQFLIDRLQRRFLQTNGHEPRRPAMSPSAR